MKAQVFLELVDKTLATQQNYFTAVRKFGRGSKEAMVQLIESKNLERQCFAVIKEGRLEPDEPTVLDAVAIQRPTELQANLFNGDDNEQQTEGH